MKTLSKKKQVRTSLKNAMTNVLVDFQVASPSGKTKKTIAKASKRVSAAATQDLKNKQKRDKIKAKKSKKKNGAATKQAEKAAIAVN